MSNSNFSLFKTAELGSATKKFKSGEYSWEYIPSIKNSFKAEFSQGGLNIDAAKDNWLWKLVGAAVFDIFEQIAISQLSRDEVLSQILSDPAFSGKDPASPEVRQELGARMSAQPVRRGPPSAADILELANAPGALDLLLSKIASLGCPRGEFHTYVSDARENEADFSNSRSMSAFIARVNELRSQKAAVAPKSVAGTLDSNNELMEYIRQNAKLGDGLTIEAFGATHRTQTNSEASKELAARCLAEQNEGGGVCVHSVHLNKVLGGISLFASVRGPEREHVATIKFEDSLIYEIKGHNNGLVAEQLKISEEERQAMRSAVKAYISKMLTDGIVDGFSQAGKADFANLLHPEEISSAISSGTEDYSAILPSHHMSSEQIEIIWDRIRGDKSRTKEFAAMAGNKNTPPEIQRDLLAIGDKSVNAALARNENLDPEVHDQLSIHADRLVRHRALAHPLGQNKEIDQEEILKMLGSRDSKVVARAAASPLAPQEKLIELGASSLTDPNIKANLLINPNLKLETKQTIFDTMPVSAQLSILDSSDYGARSPDIKKLKLPEDVILGGLSDYQLASIARHTTYPDSLSLIIRNKNANGFVLSTVAGSPAATPEILASIIGHESVRDADLYAVARSHAATPEILMNIIDHEQVSHAGIYAVAKSPAATPKILARVIGNKLVDNDTLAAVAGSPAATPEILASIAGSKLANDNILAAVARSPAATPKILASILEHKNWDGWALTAIVHSPVVTPEILASILKSEKAEDDSHLYSVARSPAATSEILASIAGSELAGNDAMAAVARSHAVTPDILANITGHKWIDSETLRAVAYSPVATPEILANVIAHPNVGYRTASFAKERLAKMSKKTSSTTRFPLFKCSFKQFRLFH